MKAVYLLLLLLGSGLFAAAQVKCGIKKAWAYYTVSAPGAQMSDDNGNPIEAKPAIERFVYIEWSGTAKPQLVSVLYNNRLLVGTLTAVEGRSVIPGNNPENNSDAKINIKKPNTLYKIDLQAKPGADMPATGVKNILIRMKAGGKSCSLKLTRETQLMTLPRY